MRELGLGPPTVFVSYVGRSSGTDSACADRFSGALLWQGKRVRAGAAVTVALGVQDDSKQNALVADAFARVEPIDRLLLGARFSYWNRNTTAPSADVMTTLLGSVGWRIADPLEVHVVVSRALPASLTRSELAGSDYLEVAGSTGSGQSCGRLPNGTGTFQLNSRTPGLVNAGP